MKINEKHYRTIWLKEKGLVQIIDQRSLPHEFIIEDLKTVADVARAIKEMHVRGAGLIGATAGFGMYIAALTADKNEPLLPQLATAGEQLKVTRPTAVNLAWAVDRQLEAITAFVKPPSQPSPEGGRSKFSPPRGELEGGVNKAEIIQVALETAQTIADEDAEFCRRIGEHGVSLIEEISQQKNGDVVNILTHCNAGWLAFVDYGSATAPIYAAHDKGIKVHVWVDETRPRNQGARLTAWELGQHGVPHTVIADNVGGHLMQHGLVDMVIVGTDRTTYTGDVGNKIGTYLKALAAHDNGIPFYTALPSSTFDWQMRDGVREIPIEQRGGEEVKYIQGLHNGEIKKVLLTPADSPAANFAFDVTPARLVTGLITERGICAASEDGVLGLYPEKRK